MSSPEFRRQRGDQLERAFRLDIIIRGIRKRRVADVLSAFGFPVTKKRALRALRRAQEAIARDMAEEEINE